ncbi:SET domain-containing protein-lysine N-methyltransferase [Sphingomonas sp.]|uniref:SET domain-containing protein-lysine N-methyltransferase n=1 Tax=Sphingomonas sp. TaxID=28214 RepID=UPI0025E23A40|nr:SET domain-containing protein-lysine N-methyltransferase [Sphingomonas sp.]
MHSQSLHTIKPWIEGGPGLRARRDIAEGTKLYRVSGMLSALPTRTSLQVGAALHIDSATAEWRFIEHSCAPNLHMDFVDWSFRADRDIAVGELLTFNYLTTEARMAAPFTCSCGESECFGEISGFAKLAHDLKERLRNRVAPHLWAGEAGGCIFGAFQAMPGTL